MPCIGYAANADEVRPLAQAGADFVALGDWIWTHAARSRRRGGGREPGAGRAGRVNRASRRTVLLMRDAGGAPAAVAHAAAGRRARPGTDRRAEMA